MIFKEEIVLNFFLEKRIVATMRNGRYGLMIGERIDVVDGSGNLVGRAKVVAVLLNYPKFRRLLVKYSGFPTVEQWERAARSLYKGKLPKFIVLLQLAGVDVNREEFEEINEIVYDVVRDERGDDET